MASGATVLIVDDEAPLRATIARTLSDQGYCVAVAADALEALRVLQSAGAEIRLVITDVRMPRMVGYELAARISTRPNPVSMIFISGYRQAGEWLPGSVLPKPFSMDALLIEVRRLVPAV